MQKKLIALAVAGLASTGAFAQSNVTVYGNIDIGVANYSGTSTYGNTRTAGAGLGGGGAGTASVGVLGGGSRTEVASGLHSTSFVGFKGTEKLGGGMTADFVLEFRVNVDGGSADATGSLVNGKGPALAASNSGLAEVYQSYLSLTTDVGQFRAGRMYTPHFIAIAAIAPLGMTGVGAGGNVRLAQTRANSALQYGIKVGPFAGSVQYAMSENSDGVISTVGGSVTGLNAFYNEGPIRVAYGYAFTRDALAGVKTGALGAGTNAAARGATAVFWTLGGTYDFGAAKVFLAYDSATSKGIGSNTSAANGAAFLPNLAGTDVEQYNHGDWTVGVNVPAGAHMFRASYSKLNDKSSRDNDSTHVGLGYGYEFSKRTSLQAQYGSFSNKNGAIYNMQSTSVGDHGGLSGASFTTIAATGAPVAAQRTKGLTVGMVHNF